MTKAVKSSKVSSAFKPEKLSKKEVLAAFDLMVRVRRFEEKAANLYQQGQIGGFCHVYIGQEAVIAGCHAATIEGDDYITSYRCHAHTLAAGVSSREIMAELTGRAAGITKGKGGSMHMFYPKGHFWGGHGIVGAQVPLGAGLAFASKYRKTDNVSLTFIGDGAMNEGATLETINIAALWKLPIVFVIENNRYGMGTSVERASAGDLWRRGEPYGIPGRSVDGMDFLSVYEAMAEACHYVRGGNGPMIVELNTYRYRGHSMSDPAKYRERSEVDEMKDKHDPINGLRRVLMNDYGVAEAKLKEMDKKAKEEAADAATFAVETPEPPEEALWTDILPPENEEN